MTANNSQTNKINGFTLIEITIALFLLAVSLSILLGLQGSVISRSIDDHNRLQAMLLARRVFSGIENGDTEIQDQDISTPASEYLPQDSIKQEDQEILKNFIINLKIEPWSIPGYDDMKIQRIFLNIAWGNGEDQSVPIYYFVPLEENETTP